MRLSANSVSAVSLGGRCNAIEFNVPFLKGLEKAIQAANVRAFQLAGWPCTPIPGCNRPEGWLGRSRANIRLRSQRRISRGVLDLRQRVREQTLSDPAALQRLGKPARGLLIKLGFITSKSFADITLQQSLIGGEAARRSDGFQGPTTSTGSRGI